MKINIVKLINFWKSEEQEDFIATEKIDASFILRYNSLKIGNLTLHNGVWHFRYLKEFKNQFEVKPLPDFPNIDQEYEAMILHPFFLQRIPGKGQMKQEHEAINNDVVTLLKQYGRRTIANPFILEPG